MVGSLSKDDAAITVNIPLPDTPLTLKNPVNNVGDNPRSMKSLLESSLTKRANNKVGKAPAADQLLGMVKQFHYYISVATYPFFIS